jgi:AraC-like DNA-binding protein
MAVPLSVTAVRAGSGGLRLSSYRELTGGRPGPVSRIWTGRPGWSPRSLLLLPDGCVDLVWDGTAVLVVPPRPVAVRHNLTGKGFTAGVRLRAGWAALTLQANVGSLPTVADLADVRPDADLARLTGVLASKADPVQAARILASWAARMWPADSVPDTRLLSAIDLLSRSGSSVSAAASGAGFSVRELHRRFTEHIGLSPKSFQRLSRFQRFRSLIAGTEVLPTMAAAAAMCGYADQAHLAHDCHDLAGRPPTALARAVRAGRRPPAGDAYRSNGRHA